MAVALSDADVAALGPSAKAQIGASERPAVAPATKAAAPAAGTATLIRASSGPSERTRAAAGATRTVWRATGAGRASWTGHPTARGIIWVFVWLGILFYLVSNPATLPSLVHTIFAPINGVLAVARGTHPATQKASA